MLIRPGYEGPSAKDARTFSVIFEKKKKKIEILKNSHKFCYTCPLQTYNRD